MVSQNNDSFLRNKLFNSVILLTISRGFAQLMFFIVRYILLINWLTPDDLNKYIIFFKYLELLLSLIIIGPYVIPKFIAEEKYKLNKLLSNIFIIILTNTIVLLIGFSLIAKFTNIEEMNTQAINTFIITLVLGEVFLIAQKQFECIFLGLKNPKIIFYSNMILSVVFITFSAIFVLVYSFGNLGGIFAYIIALFCSFIYQFIFLQKLQKIHIQWKLEKIIFKEIILYALPLFIGGLFYFVNYRMNSLFLQDFQGNLLIYYDTGMGLLIYLIGFIGIPIQDAIFPYITKTINDNDNEKTKQIFFDTTKIIALFFFSILLAFFILVDLFYPLIFPSFNDPLFYTITRFLILGGFFYILNQFYARIPAAKGKTYVILIGQGIGAIINVICLIIFLKTELLLWLLLGFTISCLSLTILYVKYVIEITKLKLIELKLFRMSIAFFSSIILAYFLDKFSLNSFLSLIIVLPVYFLFLFIFRIISIQDLYTIKNYLKNTINTFNLRKKKEIKGNFEE